MAATMTEKKGLLAAMKIVRPTDELMIISEEGVVVRTPVQGISQLGRSTQGVCVMKACAGDKVTAVAVSSTGKKRKVNKSVDEPETIVDAEEDIKNALDGEMSEADIDLDDDDAEVEGEETEEQ